MPRLTDRRGSPNTGIMHGAVVGIVTDNVDPDELGRIQVKFPTLHGEPLSFWLRQVSPMGGKERGLYMLPEIDDEVLVIFMQGSQDVGCIVGQFWNGIDKPPPEAKDGMPGAGASEIPGLKLSTDTFTDGSTSLASNDRRFFRSRSGSIIVFDDTGGAESIQLWDKNHNLGFVMDPNENRILLFNKTGDVHVRTKNDFYIEAGNNILLRAGNNIEGESVNDTIHKAGMNIQTESGMNTEMKAGMDFTASADMNLTATASMDAKFNGDMNATLSGGIAVSVEGGASATVKAAVVMIN